MKNKYIFIVNGYPGSGKDTFIDIIKKKLNSEGHFVHKSSYVTAIKEVAEKIGWNGKKDERGRKLLADICKASTDYNNFLLDNLYFTLRYTGEHNNLSFLFWIVRDPNVIKKIKKDYPETKTIIIKRENLKNFDNCADKNINEIEYDIVIENNGTMKDLEDSCELFIKNVLGIEI